MLSTLLTAVGSPAYDETKALKRIKAWVKNNPTVSLDPPIAEIPESTLAIKAAERGFTHILRYLIEVKKCDPNRRNKANKTPLLAAILNKQEEAAEYVLPRTTTSGVDDFLDTLLHHAVNAGLSNVVAKLIQAYPHWVDSQNKAGETPLFLAAKQGMALVVSILLSKDSSPNLCDVHGVTPFGAAFRYGHANAMRALLSHPTTCPILFDSLSSQINLQLAFFENTPVINRMECLNILFAAGAGLELSHIIDPVLEAFKLNRSQLRDCLILGEKKGSDGKYKKSFVTSVESFEAALKSPSWRFESAQLARCSWHPLLKALPHVQKVRTLLPPVEEKVQKALQIPPVETTRPLVMTDMTTITALSKEAVISSFETENLLLEQLREGIGSGLATLRMYVSMDFPIDKLAKVFACPNIDRQMIHYFETLNKLIEMANHPISAKLGSKDRAVYDLVFKNFAEVIQHFVSFFMNVPMSAFSLKYVSLLETRLRHIVKHHGKAIRVVHSSLYNSLIDAQAFICHTLAGQQLKIGNNDVALTLALQSMQYNDALILDNKDLAISATRTKAVCCTTMAEVFIRHGWIHKAARHVSKALQCNKESGFIFDPLLFELCQKLANTFVKQNKKVKAISLLRDAMDSFQGMIKLWIDNKESTAVMAAISKQETLLSKEFFSERIIALRDILKEVATIEINEDEHEVQLIFQAQQFNATNKELMTAFLSKNPSIGALHDNRLILDEACLFANPFLGQLKQLKSIVLTEHKIEHVTTPDEDDKWVEDFARYLQIKKGKAPAESTTASEEAEETYGFKKLPGFTPPIPISSKSLPKDTLFMTMPKDEETFQPFYKLVQIKNSQEYNEIRAIPDGPNQQGVKLGTKTQNDGAKVAYGRLKVLGANGIGSLRARGYVEQTIEGEHGKQRKLYVFREVLEKKKEERDKYRL